MTNFFSLPIAEQAKLSQDSLFKYYGVTIPVTTEQSKNNLIKAKNSYVPLINQINSALWQGPIGPNGQPNQARAASAREANNSPIPNSIQNELSSVLPAGYTFDGTLGQLSNTLNAMAASVDTVVQNPIQLPPMGAGVTYNPNNTTPPVGTVVTPTRPTLPTYTTPPTITAPSTNTPSSTISNILTAAAVIGGGALVVNALNNRVQNSTAAIPQRQVQDADPEGTANIQEQNARPQKQTQDADPEGTANIQEQNARPQKQIQDNDPEGNANVEEQFARPQKQPQDADPEGTANIQEQNARPQKQIQDNDPEGNANVEEQFARPQKQPQDADPEGTANIQEQNAAANEEAIRNAGETPQGLTTAKLNTQSQATQQDAVNFQAKKDWRVRLSLSPGATYLYKASLPGILAPLQATDGVIFPYTPAISVQYTAGYDPTELTHSNYKFFTYKGSAVDNVTIGCDFTAQDTFEAQYVLAVIHFFKSITKMFYGQDQNPTNGTPPPLCYLTGLGAFQFDTHPLVVTAFTYTLPTDVDYIQAGSNFAPAGVNTAGSQPKQDPFADAQSRRLASNALNPGATVSSPNWQTTNIGTKDATYVPTKISISISAFPIITRNDISNTFSLREYATGALLRGSKRAGGGIW